MHPAHGLDSLEEFRYQIRRFLDFSRRAARAAGLAPQQHQMLLVLAGSPRGRDLHIRLLADRLLLNHNTAVELVNRLERRGLARRVPHPPDRRQVGVHLTTRGARLLARLTRHHLVELRSAGPQLVRSLHAVIQGARRQPRRAMRPRRKKR